MNAQEERIYYEREHEADQCRQRYDPHGEIITDAEREIWKQEQKTIDYSSRAEKERASLYRRLLEPFNEHGVIPNLNLLICETETGGSAKIEGKETK